MGYVFLLKLSPVLEHAMFAMNAQTAKAKTKFAL